MRARHTGNTTHLPVDEIKTLLDNGMRQKDVARLFNVSQATICRQAGQTPAKKTKKEGKLCSCCGTRKIAKGNRMLCRVCQRTQSNDYHTVWV